MQTQSTRTVWLSHHISFFFFFNDTATTEIYTLSLHDALPIYLAVGCLSRTPYARYPEYHTSADNLDFVRPDALADSYEACLATFDVLEGNEACVNQHPKGEPQLGRRGLYQSIGGQRQERGDEPRPPGGAQTCV